MTHILDIRWQAMSSVRGTASKIKIGEIIIFHNILKSIYYSKANSNIRISAKQKRKSKRRFILNRYRINETLLPC